MIIFMCLLSGCMSLGLWSLLYGLVKACQTSFLDRPWQTMEVHLRWGGFRLQFFLWLKRASTGLAFSSTCIVSLYCPLLLGLSSPPCALLLLFLILVVSIKLWNREKSSSPSAPCTWCTELSSKLPVARLSAHRGCLCCPDKAVNISEQGVTSLPVCDQLPRCGFHREPLRDLSLTNTGL